MLAALGLALDVRARSETRSGTPLTTVVATTKTNNVMALNFALTAWPNATATPRLLALRSAAAQLSTSTPSAGAMFMPIIGGTNGDYFPGTPPLLNPDDPTVDLPPDLVDGLPVDVVTDVPSPVDGGSTGAGGSSDVPPSGFFWIQSAAAASTVASQAAAVKVAANTPFRITSRDLVSSLNGVTNNGAAMHFGNSAQLMFKQVCSPLTLTVNSFGTNRQVIVREKISGHNVDTDVSQFFTANDNYISTLLVNSNPTARKLSSLSFVNANKLGLQLSAVLTEVAAKAATNGVIKVVSLGWDAHGSGQASGNTPNLIIMGAVGTSGAHLE